ncbi:HPP family-domain-containing protein [Microdochium trichocladiopsis]|uniref:HPP family-domain-containing protein n=1 Tax=Microdochium trichocladiopsis TaxID=1682393 RepID=A0A9P8Y6Z0_9PEZI|nr:HPP family-domain-containing protein [Microdochium trichocladiopsis]KAH7031300.1 HPP family-domain-containing protein [Microdochium trichocladiopsis]
MDEKPSRTTSAGVPAWLKRWAGMHSLGPPPAYALYVWPFVGSFCSLAVLQAVFGHSWYFIVRGSPALVTSYGASVVLCFDKIESPFAQPPALVGGHFVSGLIGVIISKILYGSSTLEDGAYPEYTWVAASFATAFAILAMQLTRTTHPPAGATALLPILDRTTNKLSWYFLPILLLSSTLVLAIALLINNIQRRYPSFWFDPSRPTAPKKPAPAEMSRPAAEMPPQSSPKDAPQPSDVPDDLEAGLPRNGTVFKG